MLGLALMAWELAKRREDGDGVVGGPMPRHMVERCTHGYDISREYYRIIDRVAAVNAADARWPAKSGAVWLHRVYDYIVTDRGGIYAQQRIEWLMSWSGEYLQDP